MIADALLSRLSGVKQTGADRWMARCPAHDDHRPSLSAREIDGDRVLVHCWAGCSVEDVLAAIGLALSDLFPKRPSHRGKPERRPFPAADVLRAVEWEVLIVAVAASYLGNRGALTEDDRKRLLLAASRIGAAVQELRYG
jgi:hypothetical protein